MIKPFFKWPGSKSWLINQLADIWPVNSLRVVEPFAGSAAFYLGGGCSAASKLKNCPEDYLRIRSENPVGAVSAAGRLIFLTNTSWGGLYRENLNGQFNVPFGNNGRSFFCEDTILSASEKLKNAEILHWGFAQTLEATKKDDLIFVDAPYVTKTNAEFFDRYHATRFGWDDQLLLSKLLNLKKYKKKNL